ncbi:hypothetical protein AADZ90_020315 [Aestuariibius sp. 2305UL40-4]|uniref:hypothetical protein n=1 Tax=Aestuariibius violaceus TaxID=3234132 RepID=UPI00345EDE26
MIRRIWHGYATHENADRYQGVVTGEVIPGILAMKVPGFQSIELLRRAREEDVEFITIMRFRDLDAVKGFVGEDYERSHVPTRAQKVLAHYDTRAQHYDTLLVEEVR